MEGYQTMADSQQASQPLAGNEVGGGGGAAAAPPPGQWDAETGAMSGAPGEIPDGPESKGAVSRQNLLGLLTLVSIFQWVNAAVNCTGMVVFPVRANCDSLPAYDVSLGVVSCVFGGVWFLLDKFRPGQMPGIAMQVIAGFLALWWTVGALVITNSTQTVAGNEYFCIWGAAVLSLYLAYNEIAEASQLFQRGKDIYDSNQYLCVTIFAAIMVVGAAIAKLLETDPNTPSYAYAAYALSAGVISAVLSFVLLAGVMNQLDGNVKRVIAGIHLVWWLCAVGFLTVSPYGNFTTAGNGYFGVWLALYGSAMLFLQNRG